MRCPGLCSSPLLQVKDFPRYPAAEPWPGEGYGMLYLL